jgi:hypothetical protein
VVTGLLVWHIFSWLAALFDNEKAGLKQKYLITLTNTGNEKNLSRPTMLKLRLHNQFLRQKP